MTKNDILNKIATKEHGVLFNELLFPLDRATVLEEALNEVLKLGQTLPIDSVSVSFFYELKKREKFYKYEIIQNFKYIQSESVYKKLDSLEPFIRLVSLYKNKLSEIESLIEFINNKNK